MKRRAQKEPTAEVDDGDRFRDQSRGQWLHDKQASEQISVPHLLAFTFYILCLSAGCSEVGLEKHSSLSCSELIGRSWPQELERERDRELP